MRARYWLAALALLASVPAHAGSAVWPSPACISPANWNQSSQRWPAPKCSGTAGAVQATMQWLSATGTYIGTDSYDAASGYAVALNTGTGLPVAAGNRAILPFTVAGGAPTLGQTVWLAGSQDDGADTARSFATATLPVMASPSLGVYVKNIVPIGTVASAVNLGTVPAPKYTVTMASAIQPTHSNVSDSSAVLNAWKNTTYGVDYLSCVTSTAQQKLGVGETVIAAFTVDSLVAATNGTTSPWIIVGSGGTGVGISGANNGASPQIYTGALGFSAGSPYAIGVNVVTMWRAGGLINVSVNGKAAVTVSDTGTDPTGTTTMYLDWVYGRLLWVAKFNDVHTAPAVDYTPILTPYQPPASLTGNSHCQWYIDFTAGSSTPVAQAGPAGTGFALTKVGTPANAATTLNWYRNPGSLFIGGPASVFDGQGLWRSRAFAHMRFTASTIAEVAALGTVVSQDDKDNEDEGLEHTRCNGVPLVSFGSTADAIKYPLYPSASLANGGDPITAWRTACGSTGPFIVDAYVSDKITRWDTFDSGGTYQSIVLPSTVTIATSSTTNILEIVGDGLTYGGHGDDLLSASSPSGAPCARAQDTYPGTVVCPTVTATASVSSLTAWGNGSATPIAQFIYDQAKAASSRTYVFGLGLQDWRANLSTAAAYGTKYAAIIDGVHALDPSATFYIVPPVNTTIYANNNTRPQTLQTFVNTASALTSGRAWLTSLNLTAGLTFAGAGPAGSSLAQPAGAAALTSNLRTAVGW